MSASIEREVIVASTNTSIDEVKGVFIDVDIDTSPTSRSTKAPLPSNLSLSIMTFVQIKSLIAIVLK